MNPDTSSDTNSPASLQTDTNKDDAHSMPYNLRSRTAPTP